MAKRLHDDPQLHVRYNPFLKSRSQAWYRGEDWDLTFEEYCQLWTWEHWILRGRGPTDFAMVRKDVEQGWSLDNCEIVTRTEQLRRTGRNRTGSFLGRKKNGTYR